MKYNKLTGVILKKQNYREADQIITVWTRELGKFRVMARGIRLNKSKLAFAMQDLSEVEIEVVGNKALPALISAKPLQVFNGLREDLAKTVAAFYSAELMMKMTADEQPITEAYGLMTDFLDFVHRADISKLNVYSTVDCFSLQLLKSLGFYIEHAQGVVDLPPELARVINLLMECQYSEIESLNLNDQLAENSHSKVKAFIEYVLERNIKSDQFLASA
jgi:DNA repair protein RecO